MGHLAGVFHAPRVWWGWSSAGTFHRLVGIFHHLVQWGWGAAGIIHHLVGTIHHGRSVLVGQQVTSVGISAGVQHFGRNSIIGCTVCERRQLSDAYVKKPDFMSLRVSPIGDTPFPYDSATTFNLSFFGAFSCRLSATSSFYRV